MFAPSQKFIKLEESWLGVSGGNPYGELWFCGIEYGGDEDTEDLFKKRWSRLDRKAGLPCFGDAFISYVYDECTKWQYLQKAAKIALAYEGKPLKSYKDYIRNNLCRANDNTFLMNLYPINCPKKNDELWGEAQFKLTGFPNKTAYKAWCMQNRFPKLKRLAQKYRPKTIICTGSKAAQEFKLAFMDSKNIFNEAKDERLSKNLSYKRFIINNGKTQLLIVPFLGFGGITADADLIKLAKIAKKGN